MTTKVPKIKNKIKIVLPQVYIYLRCSTSSQSVDTHDEEIKKYCQQNDLEYNEDNIYRDQGISGNKPWIKRQIFTIINKCKKGDHIVVSELSRLSRRSRDIHEIIGLIDDKGVKLHCIKEKIKNDGSITSTMMLGMLSIVSQMERDLAVARTRSAMDTMREKGVKIGPKLSSPLDKHRESIEYDFKEEKLSMSEIAKKYNTSQQALRSYAMVRGLHQKRSYKDVILKIPEKSQSGRKIKGSMYDQYIDHINKDLQEPNITLKSICEKYDFKIGSFYLWFNSRSC